MGWVTLTLRKRELKQQHAYYQMRDLQISREKRQLARRKQYETASIQTQQKQALQPIKTSYNEAMDEIDAKKKALNEYLEIAQKVANGEAGACNDTAFYPDENGKYAYNPELGTIITMDRYIIPGKTLEDIKSEGTVVGTIDGDIATVAVEYSDLEKSDDGGAKWTPNNFQTSSWGNYDDIQKCTLYQMPDIISDLGLTNLEDINENNISSLETSINNEISNLQIESQTLQTDYMEDTNYEKTIYENELAMLEEEVNDQELMLDLEQSDVESQMEAVSQEMQAVSEAVSSEIQNSTIKLA